MLTAFGPFHPLDTEIDLDNPAAGLINALLDSLPFFAISVWSLVDAYRSARRSAG